MDSDNISRGSGELSSPRFDTVATNRAHPVVPLSNTSVSTAPGHRGIGLLAALRRVRPAVLVVAAVLVAAVLAGAATAIYRHQQSSLAPAAAQGSDLAAPAASLTAEEAAPGKITSPVPTAKRRANSESITLPVPLRREAEPSGRAEVLGTIREILQERSQSRERGEPGDQQGKHRDRHRRKDKRGKDGDDH